MFFTSCHHISVPVQSSLRVLHILSSHIRTSSIFSTCSSHLVITYPYQFNLLYVFFTSCLHISVPVQSSLRVLHILSSHIRTSSIFFTCSSHLVITYPYQFNLLYVFFTSCHHISVPVQSSLRVLHILSPHIRTSSIFSTCSSHLVFTYPYQFNLLYVFFTSCHHISVPVQSSLRVLLILSSHIRTSSIFFTCSSHLVITYPYQFNLLYVFFTSCHHISVPVQSSLRVLHILSSHIRTSSIFSTCSSHLVITYPYQFNLLYVFFTSCHHISVPVQSSLRVLYGSVTCVVPRMFSFLVFTLSPHIHRSIFSVSERKPSVNRLNIILMKFENTTNNASVTCNNTNVIVTLIMKYDNRANDNFLDNSDACEHNFLIDNKCCHVFINSSH